MRHRIFRNGSSEFCTMFRFDACIHSSMRIMPQVKRRGDVAPSHQSSIKLNANLLKIWLQRKQLVYYFNRFHECKGDLNGKKAACDAISTWCQCPSAFRCDQRYGFFISHSLHLSVYICVFINSSGFYFNSAA